MINLIQLNQGAKKVFHQKEYLFFKFSFTQFYNIEHAIVNKYSDMIADEVKRYKNEMLDYFHARETNINNDHSLELSDTNRQLYTTSLARTTYEIEDYLNYQSDLTQKVSTTVEGQDDSDNQTFLTEDATSIDTVPCSKSFQIPSNLVQSIMFK